MTTRTALAPMAGEEPASGTPAPSTQGLAQLDRLGLASKAGRTVVGRRPLFAGLLVIFAFFGLFAGWAATARLTSASLAPGMVSVEGEHKTVQHYEGGIVRRILASDGDDVRAGEVLIELDNVQARTELELLQQRLMLGMARAARLRAERDDLAQPAFSHELADLPDGAGLQQAVEEQRRIFIERRRRHAGMLDRSRERIGRLEQVLAARRDEARLRKRQLALVREELGEIVALRDRGLATRDDVYELRQNDAELASELSADLAGLATQAERIDQVRLEIEELEDGRRTRAEDALDALSDDLGETRQRIRGALDVLRRTSVVATTSGTVHNSKVHTVGGVVMPGEPLMTIVPRSARLLVAARVRTDDRDIVRVGLPAEIRFTAFNRRNARQVRGRVMSVSADSMVAQEAGEPYYLARIEFLDDPSSVLGSGAIYPGMQTDVTIVTGDRTPLEYFLKPLMRSFSRAMRDQ